jgi:tetratricopeptide (TPR) repeat protein
VAYANLDLYREAEDAYQRALRSQADNINAIFNLGQLYAAVGEKAKAEEQLAILTAVDPWKAEALRNAIVRGKPIR